MANVIVNMIVLHAEYQHACNTCLISVLTTTCCKSATESSDLSLVAKANVHVQATKNKKTQQVNKHNATIDSTYMNVTFFLKPVRKICRYLILSWKMVHQTYNLIHSVFTSPTGSSLRRFKIVFVILAIPPVCKNEYRERKQGQKETKINK